MIIPGRLFLFDDFKGISDEFTLIFYDMRGRGLSDPIPGEKRAQMLGIHHDVKDVERVRNHFGIKKFSLIGYSYLGLMSVMYAMEYPGRVERIATQKIYRPNAAYNFQKRWYQRRGKTIP